MNKNQLSSIITLAVIVIIVFAVTFLKKADYSYLSLACDKIVTSILIENGINTQTPLKSTQQPVTAFRKKAQLLEKEFIVPQEKTLGEIKNAFLLSDAFAPLVIGRLQDNETKQEQILIIEFYYKDLKLYRLVLRQKIITAKIAIVIDDWGYSNKALNKTLELGIPVTCAILPNLPYSAKIAQALTEHGHEFILHLPLEPYNAASQPLEKNTIFTSMSQEEIENIIRADFASLPHLKGVNNHMGSKATESEYVMSILFNEIKKNNLYFLDSYTTNNSITTKVAQEKGISFFKRNIFLDDKNDRDLIKDQLTRAKKIAAAKGSVIVIGHARELTIDTIKEIIPEFKKEGFGFIYLSEIPQAVADSSLEPAPETEEEIEKEITEE